ncbi:hypothetical protein [Streptomyces melanogenes]|uniref:hypothetical protein n=1 Tax=Streptomyces melanogenes TaxID=67326 RepID=UPI00167ED13B|nr:hypothetical protein [Streptomyces melanogenes]GGP78482.1 hypothetical protein GCM10010278_66160 [Streptomyces melanogenes]
MPAKAKQSVRERRKAVWDSLNERQQIFLRTIYDLDQANEANRGRFDSRPAEVWRQIDFTHDPYNRELFGITALQSRLESAGHHSQGNGATMTHLIKKNLIEQGLRPVAMGVMITVTLTREGRAVYRAGNHVAPVSSRQQVDLTERSWQVMGKLWDADRRGTFLKWGYSTTIDHVLIDKHHLAERADGGYGYRLTDHGRTYYRAHWTEYAEVYPDIDNPHPDGIELWPASVDTALARAQARYNGLARAWQEAREAADKARERAARPDPEPMYPLESEGTEMAAERHTLTVESARREAALAERQMRRLEPVLKDAAFTCARDAAAVFTAAAAGKDPAAALEQPARRTFTLPKPPSTGLDHIDDHTAKLHAQATAPTPPPAPKTPAPRRSRSAYTPPPPAPPAPYEAVASYASHLARHVAGGALTRRLHTSRAEAEC